MTTFHSLPRVYELERAPHAWSHWGDYATVLVHGLSHPRLREEEPLRIERTGPFLPPVMLPGPVDVLVTDAVRAQLVELVRELRFREVALARVVRLDWQAWNPAALEPRALPASFEPADYVLQSPHDERLAAAIGPVWEVVADIDFDVEDEDGELCPENYYGQPLVRGELCRGKNFVSADLRDAFEQVAPGAVAFRPARAVRRAPAISRGRRR